MFHRHIHSQLAHWPKASLLEIRLTQSRLTVIIFIFENVIFITEMQNISQNVVSEFHINTVSKLLGIFLLKNSLIMVVCCCLFLNMSSDLSVPDQDHMRLMLFEWILRMCVITDKFGQCVTVVKNISWIGLDKHWNLWVLFCIFTPHFLAQT